MTNWAERSKIIAEKHRKLVEEAGGEVEGAESPSHTQGSERDWWRWGDECVGNARKDHVWNEENDPGRAPDPEGSWRFWDGVVVGLGIAVLILFATRVFG